MVSRVFGFVRDILTAAILGAGPVADAFFVAQRLPNLFRSLFAEGAFSAAFVPLAAGSAGRRRQAGAAATSPRKPARCCSRRCWCSSCSAKSSCRWVMHVDRARLRAPSPAKFALVVALTRITFPYLLFISLVALQGGLLNALDRFAAAGGDADAAQPLPDRGAAADGALRLAAAGRCSPGR